MAQFSVHLAALALLGLVPVIFMSINHNHHPHVAWDLYGMACIWVAVFYASYYCTTDPTTGKQHAVTKFILQIILIATLAIAVMFLMRHFHNQAHRHDIPFPLLQQRPPGQERPPGGLNPAAMHSVLVILLTIALGQAIKFIYKTFHAEQRKRELEAKARESELQQLKTQLKPHFLFNSLNTIYALIDIDPEKARLATHSLSKLLRHTLTENGCAVTLAEELTFITNYVELMKLRTSAAFPVHLRLNPGTCENLPMAPLMFINLIENAFKHGTCHSAPGPIEIDITAQGKTVECRVSNPRDPDRPQHNSTGIGLTNLRRRLELLYPDKHSLSIDASKNSFLATLSIDISQSPYINNNPVKQ